MDKQESIWRDQALPLFLTVVTFLCLFGILFLIISALNHLNPNQPILLELRWPDVIFGITIYLKTSVDFAIFIGNLIKNNSGYKSRIAVEIGTALGNAAGTVLILILWNFFKELTWLLAIMVFSASLVLLRMAEDSLEHARTATDFSFAKTVRALDRILGKINKVFDPLLKRIVPHGNLTASRSLKFWPLLLFAFTIPFILGMDDFAGYVPLFSIINVFGFATGVFLGHMILNILLYLSPAKTIKTVSHPIISLLGSLVFVGLAIYGFSEVYKILFLH